MSLTATQSRVADLKKAVVPAMENRLAGIFREHLSLPERDRIRWSEQLEWAVDYQLKWAPRALLNLDPSGNDFRWTGRVIRELREAAERGDATPAWIPRTDVAP